MGHQAYGVRFRQIEKLENQLEKIFQTIGFHFQPHGVATAGASRFLLVVRKGSPLPRRQCRDRCCG